MVSERENRHNANLDFLRGAAALMVVFEHLSKFNFVTPQDLQIKSAFISFFYLFRDAGGDAVMIFFVLSGFLIGGSVFETEMLNRWSWLDYLIKRLSRLWTVLVPALFLTLFWDSLGSFINHQIGYDGRFYVDLNSGPNPQYLGGTNPFSFLRNLLFLQTVICPPYGSNGPLWSLANEFWYYILFPLLFLTFRPGRSSKVKIFYILLAIGLVAFLPKRMLALGIVWIFGFLAYLCVKNAKALNRTGNLIFFSFSVLTFLLIFCLTRDYFEYPDWLKFFFRKGSVPAYCLLGLAFSGTIPYFSSHNLDINLYKKISGWLSKISYTLYLFHFPILCFFYMTFRLPKRTQPSLPGLLFFSLVFISVFIYSSIMWFAFERKTYEVRKYLEKMFK